MIKYICDVCDREIVGNDQSAIFKYTEYKMQGSGMVLHEVSKMLCGACSEDVQRTVNVRTMQMEKLKEEPEKPKEKSKK